MGQGSAAEIAAAFVNARRRGRSVDSFPGMRPCDLQAAYTIQDAALALWDRELGGWKVGRINAPDESLLGANRLIGPIFADSMVNGAGSDPAMPVFAGGFAAAEAEFMLQIRAPQGAASLPETDAETLGWVSDIRIGIEVASSPYAAINSDGPCVTVADHGNNAGLVLAGQVPAELWSDLCAVAVSVDISGKEVGRATAATMLDGPLGAVRFMLRNLATRGITPCSGWWVSSGAITGVHEVAAGDRVIARFDGIGEARCTIANYPVT